jgi:hypothetical protein
VLEERKKIDGEESFDAALILEQHGAISCTVLICAKRFFITGWPLCAEEPAPLTCRDGLLVRGLLDVEATLGDCAVSGLGSGAARRRPGAV